MIFILAPSSCPMWHHAALWITPGVTQHGEEAQPQKKGHRLPGFEQGCAHRRSDDRRDAHTIARHPVFGPPAAAPLATGFCPTAALCTRRDHSESASLE